MGEEDNQDARKEVRAVAYLGCLLSILKRGDYLGSNCQPRAHQATGAG